MNPARGRTIALGAALAVLVCFVVPASVYLDNLNEFLSAPGSMTLLLLLPVLLLVALILLATRSAGEPALSRANSALAMLVLLVWMQTWLLAWDYGRLDGEALDWASSGWRRWLDIPLWLAGLAGALLLHRRLQAPLATAALAIVALQLLLLVPQALARRDLLQIKAGHVGAIGDARPMAQFSSERNVLHIVLDSFQADIFAELITGPYASHVRPALDGFTFYEEHLGSFPATQLALPALVSGLPYRNEQTQAEYLQAAFAEHSVLNAAHAAGFEVDIASDPGMVTQLIRGGHDHAFVIHGGARLEEAARLLDVALLRILPHRLKPWAHNDQRGRLRTLAGLSPLLAYRYFTHNAFLAQVTGRLATDRPRPVYKFFHLMTTHTPFVVNPDCSYAGRVMARVRETVVAQSACSLAFVARLLERMKQAGIYDNTLIVLMGDHGGHIPPPRYVPGSFEQGDYLYELPPDVLGLATPLLAIKPPGSRGPLVVSRVLSSSIDVAPAIAATIGLRGDAPAMPPDRPLRYFYGYQWHREDPVARYIEGITEYEVRGSAYDIRSWRLGRALAPRAERRQ